ncbi:ERI1 exoribonuclease 3 [Halocaridina rubra]|uniref:ERI1 exoribonuclease 3 n=1 Tax=Halocaridina rubra TaxID=373956 RepID=A0AAN9A3Q2_HALRR
MTEEIGPTKRFLFVTCGDWDLKMMLPSQCSTSNIEVPPYFHEWLNVQSAYSNLTGKFCKGMKALLKELNLVHVGTHHRGIDDCINIANILRALAYKGCLFEPSNRYKQR